MIYCLRKEVDTIDNIEVGKRLRFFRESKNLTRAAFGDLLGMSGDMINNLERGRTAFTTATLNHIYHVFTDLSGVWLENGLGPMLIEPDSVEEEIADKIRTASPFVKAFSQMLLSRSDEELAIIEKAFEDLTACYESIKKEGE